jgi:hypothetical protein
LGKRGRGWNGKWAATARWARSDPHAGTAAARAARWQQFLDEVDPDGVLTPEERHRRAKMAQRAFLAHVSPKGVDARWKR